MGSDHSPWVEVVEQPASSGFTPWCSIQGENSSKGNKTFPTIKLHGYSGKWIVVISCVSEDEPYKPHPNDLNGEDCRKGVLTMRIHNSDTLSFRDLHINKARAKEFRQRLDVREYINVDPYKTGFRFKADDIDFTAFRLCFQVFLPDSEGKITRIVPPVVSQPIYDKRHIDKNSPRRLKKHLYQQVEEQSDLCDITIQVGSWTRKYHWCVLCATPFFSKLYASNMKERRTGVINLSVGTPSSTQNALDFLYGKEPAVEIHNASDLIVVADFLMIDDLKEICMKKIKSFEVSLKSCLPLLFISSMFDVLIPRLEDFYLSHIPELLTQDEMLKIDRAAVQFIITDKTLSYVNRDDIFKFLLRWGKFRSERIFEFRELLSLVDMSDISSDVLGQLNESHPDLLNIYNFHSEYSTVHSTETKQFSEKKAYDNVFVIYPPEVKLRMAIFYVLSLTNECWYRIPIRTDEFSSSPETVIYEKDTILAFHAVTGSLWVFNLASGSCTKKKLIFLEEVNVLQHHITLTISEQRIYFIKNFRSIVLNTDARDIADEGPVDLVKFQGTASVYVSEDLDEKEVAMKPLFSIDDEVDKVCAAADLLCLLSSESQRLVVHCLKRGLRTSIDLSSYSITGENVAMSSSKRNLYILYVKFVLHIEFEASPKKIIWKAHKIQPTHFPDSLRFCELVQDKIIAESLDHAKKDTLKWQALENEELSGCKNEVHYISLPKKLSCSSWQQVVPLQLPKQVMKCHIDCPHCKFNEVERVDLFAYQLRFSSDEESSGEESDRWSELESDSSSEDSRIYIL